MLPPFRILRAPRNIRAASLGGAGSAGIKVAEAQPVIGVELVVNFTQILVRVKWSWNITLPTCCAISVDNIGQRNISIDDLPRDRIHSVRTNYVLHAVADER